MNDTRKSSEGGCNRLFAFRLSLVRWAPVPLRLMVGYGFMQHGFAKLSKGPEAFAGILHAIGVPAPHLMAWLTILIEVFGGLAVLLGALIPLASLPMAGVLLVAMFTVHWPYGFSSIKIMSVVDGRAHFGPPGYECDLLYLACLAALVVGGSGPMAIGRYFGRRTHEQFRVRGVIAPYFCSSRRDDECILPRTELSDPEVSGPRRRMSEGTN